MTEPTDTDEAAAPTEGDASEKRLGRDALIYAAAFVAARAASFIMLPVYTRYLDTADYGVLQLLQMAMDVASILLSAGVTAGIHRFYFKATTQTERHAVIVASFAMLLVFNAIGCGLLYWFADSVASELLDDVGKAGFVQIAATSFMLDALITIPLLWLQVQQRAKAYAIASVGRLVLQLSLNILFVVVLLEGVRGILWSTLITHAALGLVMSTWMFRQTGFPSLRNVLMPLYQFGLPYRLTSAGTFVLTYLDRYFLKEENGLSDTGIYSLAYQFGFLLVYLGPTPFHLAWDPQRFQLVDRPKAERDAANARGFFWFSVVLVTLAVGLCVFVRPVLEIMSKADYHPAADLVPFIMLAMLCQAFGHVMEFGIQVSEKTIWTTVGTWISVVVIVVLYVTLIPPYGMVGAAVATIGGFGARWLAFHVFSQRLFPLRYDQHRAFVLTAAGAAVVIPYLWLRPEGIVAQLGVGSLATVTYGLLVWFGVMAADERGTLLRALGAARRRVSNLRGG